LNPQPSEPQSDALPIELLPPQITIIAIAARVRLSLASGQGAALALRRRLGLDMIASLDGATMRRLIFSLFLLMLSTPIVVAQQYDLVLEGGRVMDPETGLDAVRNVGIRDGKIGRVSSEALSGRRVVHANGLVVAPGFIDLHQHGQDLESQRVKALDGVTTALEMEIGVPDVAEFLQSKAGHSLIHYGTSASHVAARAQVFGAPLPAGPTTTHAGIPEILPRSGPATDQPATPDQIEGMRERLRAELDAGGLAVGMGIQYTPGATRLEVIDMFRVAAERRLPVYTHVAQRGPRRARLRYRVY
jgi:cytosine/adenosine deaminase-related metal-dependent hydrolase